MVQRNNHILIAMSFVTNLAMKGWNIPLSMLLAKQVSVLDHLKRHNPKADLQIWWHSMRRSKMLFHHQNLQPLHLGPDVWAASFVLLGFYF